MTGKKLDPFWEHTKKIGDKEFLCKFCEHHFRGGVSIARFKSHLAGEKRLGTKVCDKVPKGVRDDAAQAIDASKRKKNKRAVSPNNDGEENSEPGKSKECAIISHPSSSMVKGTHQPTTMPRKIRKEEEKCLVDRKLAKLILSIGVPSDVIQSPIFVDFAKSLAEFGAGYEVPSRSRFDIDSIDECKKDVAKYVAQVKRPLAETGCTLIVDKVYYSREDTYFNIFVYTPKGLVLETSFKLTSSRDLADSMSDIVDNLGSRHVVQCFVGEIWFFPSFPYPQLSTCAPSEIEHFILSVCGDTFVHKILGHARSLFIKKHGHPVQSTGYETANLNAHASSFFILEAVLKDENELKASVTDDPFGRYSNFRRDGKELVQILQPIFEVLNLVSGYMSTSGYLYEAFERAKAKIEECLIQNRDRYLLIWMQFETCRMSTIQPIHKAAALLNPDYKFSEDLKDNEIEVGINYMLEKLVTSEEKESFRIQLDTYRTTLRPMFRKGMKIDVHPRIWWERYGDTFPVLRKYAIQILSQPCGMLSCHRYRLNHTCCINDYKLGVNTMLMEKYSVLEAGDEERIDLDKLSWSPEYTDDPDNQDWDTDEETIDSDLLSESSDTDDPDNQDLDIDDSELNDKLIIL